MFCFKFLEKEISVALENVVAISEIPEGRGARCTVFANGNQDGFNCDEEYSAVKKRYALALREEEKRRTSYNNASVQLPPSCGVCILNNQCQLEYAMEQCWCNAVTAHFA